MQKLVEAAKAGATVITANRRAAHSLRVAFERSQLAAGLEAWKSPAILPWPAYVAQLWSRLLASGCEVPAVLTPWQERSLWQEAISADAETNGNARMLAPLAAAAWALLQDNEVDLRPGDMEATADTRAFARWMGRFRERLRSLNSITAAEMAPIIARTLNEGALEAPGSLVLAGFDELTPQQQRLLQALESRGSHATLHSPGDRKHAPLGIEAADPARELELAARWARAQVECGAGSVAVIVPNIDARRAEIERTFAMCLHAEAMLPAHDGTAAFHISLGRKLAEWPLVANALLILRWLSEPLTIGEIGVLLRSSFITGAREERWPRARLETELLTRGGLRLSMRDVAERASWNGKPHYCPQLTRALLSKDVRFAVGEKRSPSEWAAAFRAALEAFGWPAGPLSSGEFQCFSKWLELLEHFAALDAVRAPMLPDDAARSISEMGQAESFAVEDLGAPVQIMGPFEAAGSDFDAVWITGLDARQWPPKLRPSPLLPAGVMLRHNLPHCTVKRQAEFADRMMRRLQSSATADGAARLVLSFAATDGEQELRPSPVMSQIEWGAAEQIAPAIESWYSGRGGWMEELPAAPGVRFQQQGALSTRAFTLQSECPFRAFAELRLHAREVNDQQEGLNVMQRGTIVHTLMQALWSALQSQDRLRSLAAAERAQVIASAVNEALDKHAHEFPDGEIRQPLMEIERERLFGLINEWLEVEAARKPFVVAELEQPAKGDVGGLEVSVRRDRVDQLPDGRSVIIDYKTGKIAPHKWEGERPDDPQLPLYAVTSPEPAKLAGILFAHVKAGSMGFRGLQQEPGIARGAAVAGSEEESIPAQVERWRMVLEKLAANFIGGEAQVAPKTPTVCRNCDLPALCRVAELHADNDAGEEQPDA
ncbi:MAG TPA: PD-(D/E)XK nuclease family protein [Terriglobales bacterium]|nr:PD-(D/E)XK nuclease family protein [Terriglobales bacterium]